MPPRLARLAALALLLVSACGTGQSDYQRQAATAGAEMAAAARTLEAVHQGRLRPEYARASFVNYREQLEDVDTELSASGSSVDRAQLARLRELYRAARPAFEEPCLEAGCDWRGQVRALDEAAKAFLQAGGS
jgi:hypothetical protein